MVYLRNENKNGRFFFSNTGYWLVETLTTLNILYNRTPCIVFFHAITTKTAHDIKLISQNGNNGSCLSKQGSNSLLNDDEN
jgi:hypothetical protein